METLGRAIVVNLPTLLSFFYKGIAPFLDPVTRDKMRFNPDLLSLVPAEQLDAAFGGTYEYEFEAVSYWDQIMKRCCIAADGTRTNWPKAEVEGLAGSEEKDAEAQTAAESDVSSRASSAPSLSDGRQAVSSRTSLDGGSKRSP